jgi:hypothetical protein
MRTLLIIFTLAYSATASPVLYSYFYDCAADPTSCAYFANDFDSGDVGGNASNYIGTYLPDGKVPHFGGGGASGGGYTIGLVVTSTGDGPALAGPLGWECFANECTDGGVEDEHINSSGVYVFVSDGNAVMGSAFGSTFFTIAPVNIPGYVFTGPGANSIVMSPTDYFITFQGIGNQDELKATFLVVRDGVGTTFTGILSIDPVPAPVPEPGTFSVGILGALAATARLLRAIREKSGVRTAPFLIIS